MSDRPIIMTPENVRLLIREAEQPGAGKRETRRLLYIASREQPRSRAAALALEAYPPHDAITTAPWFARLSGWHECQPGDRLWVREACEAPAGMRYRRIADGSLCSTVRDADNPKRHRASFHMSRDDSRLTLIVERVRIERLQDTSEADAAAEGVSRPMQICEDDDTSFRAGYQMLWETLHLSPNSWADNPWVVVISFVPVLANIDSNESMARWAGLYARQMDAAHVER
jgi:hypothetical protein